MSMVSSGVCGNMEDLNMMYINNLNQITDHILLEMCLGSGGHGFVAFALLGDPLGIVQE